MASHSFPVFVHRRLRPAGFNLLSGGLATWAWALMLALTLAACGGGGGTGSTGGGVAEPREAAPPAEEPTGPGRLVSATPVAQFSLAQLRAATATLGVQAPALQPTYDVSAWQLNYLTTDADGAVVTASGLVVVPAKRPGSPASPVLSYQHATIFLDAEAPSRALAPAEPPFALASLGFVVVAADYVGYGASRGKPHPYLLAAPTAASVVDLLTAARTWRWRQGVAANGQLFLAGYSEGGFATVATQRALQAGNSLHRAELVGSVPGAGPYDLAATLDWQLARVKDEYPVLGALIDPGVLRLLGSSTRNEVRRLLVRALLPGNADVVFDTRFIDAYLNDDRALIERQSNVHDWAPLQPVRLFHGRDDLTVPYVSGTSAHTAMRLRGAPDVTLTDCTARPAGHLECVPDYLGFLLRQTAGVARGL